MFIVIYVTGIVSFWITAAMLVVECLHRFKKQYPDAKCPKHSKLEKVNIFLQYLIHSIIPLWHWVLVFMFVFRFDHLANGSIEKVKKLCEERK